jgi:hypothetical protein
MPQHVPLRHDTPYRQHKTAYARHFWKRVRPSDIGVGDTIVAAAGVGVVMAIREIGPLIEFSVAGKGGNVRSNGSPLTYYKTQEVYLHDDKKCKCKEDDDD